MHAQSQGFQKRKILFLCMIATGMEKLTYLYAMNRYYFLPKVIGILIPLMAACVSDQTKEPYSDTPKKSLNPEMLIVWLGSGTQILVDGQWLYDVLRKSLKHLNLLNPISVNSNTSVQFVSYPEGYSVFSYDGRDELSIFDFDRENRVCVKIPNWVSGESEPLDDETINNVPAWLDDKNLYLHQFYKQSPNKFTCGVYSVNSTSWKKLDNKDCLESSFFYISGIMSVGNGMVATLSSAEGQQSLDFFQVNLKEESLEQKLIAKLDINAVVPTQILRKSDNSYNLVVPCVLEDKKAMECIPQSTQYWSVYEWFPTSDKLQERYKKLPYAVYAVPNSDKFVWIDKNKLCVGKPNNKNATCVGIK